MKIIATFIIINLLAINSYAFASSQKYFDEALNSYNEGKMDEATFLFEKSAVFNPKNSDTYVYLGYLNKELENLDKANHYFMIALTLQPDNLELNYLVGEYFYKDNDIDSYNKYVGNLEILCSNGCDYLDQIKKLDIEQQEPNLIYIVDFGSQVTQLIARRVREAGVYCEIVSNKNLLIKIKDNKPSGIIFSGGPASVHK